MRTYRIEIRLIQLSVLLSALVVIAGFLGAWGGTKGQETSSGSANGKSVQTQTQTQTVKKIVALGDSFTYGYPGNQDQSWTAVLQKKSNITIINKGQGYQRTIDLLSRFDTDVISEAPDQVIIFGGNGDALRSIPLEEYQTNIKALVDKSRSKNITPILALPMPYPGVQKTIKEMRDWMKNYAGAEQIVVLDFASVVMDKDNNYLDGFSNDKKYPSAKGYEAMGEYAARVLQ